MPRKSGRKRQVVLKHGGRKTQVLLYNMWLRLSVRLRELFLKRHFTVIQTNKNVFVIQVHLTLSLSEALP